MPGKLSFRLEMVGGEQVLNQLREIVALQRQLSIGTGGTGNAGAATAPGVQIITPQQLQNLERASRGTKELTKAVGDLVKTQVGGGNMGKLVDMPEHLRQMIFKQHPELQKEFEEKMAVASAKGSAHSMNHPEVRRVMRDRAAFYRDLTFGMMPLMNPGSPWGTLFGMRQMFGAMMTQTGQGFIGKMGLSGVGGAGLVAGGLVAGLTAVGLALKSFGAAIHGARNAIQQAFGIYTGAAQQGLSTQFFERRQALSGLLGVSGNPNNVFYFGKAIGELDKRIGDATRTLAENAPVLTQTDINLKVMKIDLEALFSTIAEKVAPAINLMVASLDTLINHLVQYTAAFIGMITGGFSGTMNFGTVLTQIMTDPRISGFFNKMSPLNVMAKQLPASKWEHMGLVIGGGWQQRALDYQRRAAVGIEKLVHKIDQINRKTSTSYYLAQNPFVNAH